MNDKDYRYVMTIARHGSFSRAAEALYVSQPALSRYILNLEHNLNVTLFDRSTNPICLTDAGTCFCVHAERILEEELVLSQELSRYAVCSRTPLRLGIPPVTGEYVLSYIMPIITQRYQEFSIEPIEGMSEKLCQLLAENQLDAAIISTRECSPKFKHQYLCSEPIYLVGRQDHPALNKYNTAETDIDHPLKIDFSCLRGVKMFHCRPFAILSSLSDECLKRNGFFTINEVKVSSLPLALNLAAQGLGFTCVMRSQLIYSHPDITQHLCPIYLPECTLSFYYIYNYNKNLAANKQIEIMEKHLVEAYAERKCL